MSKRDFWFLLYLSILFSKFSTLDLQRIYSWPFHLFDHFHGIPWKSIRPLVSAPEHLHSPLLSHNKKPNQGTSCPFVSVLKCHPYSCRHDTWHGIFHCMTCHPPYECYMPIEGGHISATLSSINFVGMNIFLGVSLRTPLCIDALHATTHTIFSTSISNALY